MRLPSDRVDTARLAETESDPVLDVRWWPIEALRRTRDVVEPRALVALAADVAAGDLPAVPRDLGSGLDAAPPAGGRDVP